MKKWAKISTLVGSGVLLTGAGVGAAVGIILPKALKAKESLKTVFASGGENNALHWGKNKKLNYVALGDSETAGFNMRLHGDYLSYADFLANDLQKAGRLNTYKNFAVSGAKIPDLEKQFTQTTSAMSTLHNADLITLTIGANDLLSFVKMFELPFAAVAKGFSGIKNGQVIEEHTDREKIFAAITTAAEGMRTNDGYSDQAEQKRIIEDATKSFMEIVRTKNFNRVLDFNSKIKPKIFDLIKRNFALFMKDLHTVAPHAQIMVLGHAFPFAQWDKSALETPRSDFENLTVRQIYDKFLNAMKEGIEITVEDDVEYAEFVKLDHLHIHKTSLATIDPDKHIYTDYIKYGHYNTTTRAFEKPADFDVQNAMPLAGDIHPSTFGHELLGNGLFSRIAHYLHISNNDAMSLYTLSKTFTDDGVTQPFERIDENPIDTVTGQPFEKVMFDLFHKQGTMWNFLQSFSGINPVGFFKSLFLNDQLSGMISKMFMPAPQLPIIPGGGASGIPPTTSTPIKRSADPFAGLFTKITDFIGKLMNHIESPYVKGFVNSSLYRGDITKLINYVPGLLIDHTEWFVPTDGIKKIGDLFQPINDQSNGYDAPFDPTNADHMKLVQWQKGLDNKPLNTIQATEAKAALKEILQYQLDQKFTTGAHQIDDHVTGAPVVYPSTTTASDYVEFYSKLYVAIAADIDGAVTKVASATTEDEKLYWTALGGRHIYGVTGTGASKIDWSDELPFIRLIP